MTITTDALTVLFLLLVLVTFDIAALRYGTDSRGLDAREAQHLPEGAH